MNTILISGLGGDMAQSMSKIIKQEFPQTLIHGMDISTRNAAQNFCDHFFIGKRANDPDFLNFIENYINQNKIDFFIPCTEHELRALLLLPPDSPLWKKILSCDQNILSICLDKLKTFEFLKERKINIPWYAEKVADIQNRYPCIYKKRASSGSRDIFKVKNEQEALFLFDFSPHGLFQEYLSDDDNELTCSVFRWKDGSIQTIQLLRALSGGATSWAKVVSYSEIDKLCQDVALALNLQGSLNIQLRLTDKGAMIFEINPRFSSTVYMRHLVGFKDLVWSFQNLMNQSPPKNLNIKKGIEIAKIFDVVIL